MALLNPNLMSRVLETPGVVLIDEVLTLQREFDEAIDREDYETAQKIVNIMKSKLGEDAQEVIENQITLDAEIYKKLK